MRLSSFLITNINWDGMGWDVDFGTGARFSKVPKLYGPFLGVTIPFVSQERRGFKSSNLTVIWIFVTLKTCQKDGFPKRAVASFTNGFSGPKSFRDFRETGPRAIPIFFLLAEVSSSFAFAGLTSTGKDTSVMG